MSTMMDDLFHLTDLRGKTAPDGFVLVTGIMAELYDEKEKKGGASKAAVEKMLGGAGGLESLLSKSPRFEMMVNAKGDRCVRIRSKESRSVASKGGDAETKVEETSSEAQASGGAPKPEGTAGDRLRFDEWREVVSTT